MGITSELGSEVVDIIAFVIAIIYTLVPFAFFYQFSSGVIKPINKVSILGILFLYLNGLTYFIATILSDKKGNEKIILRDFSNLSGAVLGFFYCLYYIYIMFFKDHRTKFFIYLCLIIISLLVLILIALIKEVTAKYYEYIGVVFNIFEYLPLGFDFFYLIKHKISEKYTLFSCIPGIINTIIWLIWAIINVAKNKTKYHSLIANIIGFLLCLTQIIIFFVFKKKDDISDAFLENEEDEENKLSNKEVKKSEYDDIL